MSSIFFSCRLHITLAIKLIRKYGYNYLIRYLVVNIPTEDEIVDAYHALIDLEYRKYVNSNERFEDSWHSYNEAIGIISSCLSKPPTEAGEIFRDLLERGFIVRIGGDKYRTLHFDIAYRASNIRIEHGSLRYPLEAKVYVRDEEIPRFDDHPFAALRDAVDPEVYEALEYAIFKDVNPREPGRIAGFSDFQLRAIRALLKGDKRAYILIAPTSGGKTYAFLIPILAKIIEAKLQGGEGEKRVKALIIYPRKALERDQLNKIIAILYRINYYFKHVKGLNTEITIGIDDGETPWERGVRSRTSYRGAICPYSDGSLEYFVASGFKGIRCRHCGRRFDWIYGYREQIWSEKPDILITNVWTLDFRLPSRTIEHDYALFKGLSIIVLDEAHVYQSLLGGNVRYLLKRLKLASSGEPMIVLSSATISKPEEFGKNILDLEPSKEFEVVEAGKKRAKKKVVYLIMAVHPQRSWETAVYELALLLATVFKYRGLQSVIFIDSLRELYRVHSQMLRVAALYYQEPKDHFDANIVADPDDPYNYQVYMKRGDTFDPYNTPIEIYNYVKLHHANVKDREIIEREFVDGRLGVLISTSTLELGVDYPNVSIVATIGIPFMLESIPQRIGRAGRDRKKTLNTTLAIILLRNTPLELYYLYKPEDLIEGYRKKDIPVAWRNIAVKKYHALFTVFDEMARNGIDTCILRTDGRLKDLDEFVYKILDFIDKTKEKLAVLASRTERDEDPPQEVVEDIRRELRAIPKRVEEWRKAHDTILDAYGVLANVRKLARRLTVLAWKIGDRDLERESREMLGLIWRATSG
ncbi:DEAD/DEAH box helicase [Infirmifilum sp. SLHALR2]